jgi:predicted  nucleic acid-binding Zn-ribbon protein
MKNDIAFLRRRHASLFRAVESLEHNRNAIEDHRDFVGESTDIFEDTEDKLKDIRDLIEQALSEVKAIRTAIDDKISELEAAS